MNKGFHNLDKISIPLEISVQKTEWRTTRREY